VNNKPSGKVYEDAINNWPKDERPREKLLKYGAHTLANAELLAIILRVGIKGKSAVELARQIIKEANGLRGLDKLDPNDLIIVKGLNQAKIAQIKASIELGKRILEDPEDLKDLVSSSRKAYDVLLPKMRDLKKEIFKVIFLNCKNRVIDIVTAHEGTVTMSNVYIREIINLANRFGAAAMMFAHNHPSGDSTPSHDDKQITEELVFAGRIMRIKVLDHLIIGDGQYFSFADEGLIKLYNTNFDMRKSN
jgi:DNA repair protein RadC